MLGVVGLGAAGCGKNTANAPSQSLPSGSTPGPVVVGGQGDYIALYQARRFREARDAAEAAMPRLRDRNREVAQLTAGCAAHATGDLEGAKRHLTPLTASKDPQISGRAEATLGQIAQAQGQNAYAAQLFKSAAAKLDGDDAARAGVRAGHNFSKLGKHSEAIMQYRGAAEEAESSGVRQYTEMLTEPGPFSVQAGVFSSRANAEARARQVQASAIRFGYGTPRIEQETLHGRRTFAVKIGVFPTRQAASDARNRLGAQQLTVVSAD
jgi:tetratricopeptide (TPR) repeat protein